MKGLDLSEAFYRQAVLPILDATVPGLRHSAALIGPGSEVLGFDTAQSRDHDWGPRVQLFFSPADHAAHCETIDTALRQHLSTEFLGYPTSFAPNDDGTGRLDAAAAGNINHRVGIFTVVDFFRSYLRFDPTGEITPADWLNVPSQTYCMLTAGRVFHDGLGELDAVRRTLAWYPHDVWLYLLAAQWTRIGQEEAFVGRCAQTGDHLGSRLVAGRLVKDVMNLCFLMDRQYAPYLKWFGTGYAQLSCASTLVPVLEAVLAADTFEERQEHLCAAYSAVADLHNALGITDPLPIEATQFYNRPFLVIHGETFADAIYARISDPQVLALPKFLGGVSQYLDSTDAMNFLDAFKTVY